MMEIGAIQVPAGSEVWDDGRAVTLAVDTRFVPEAAAQQRAYALEEALREAREALDRRPKPDVALAEALRRSAEALHGTSNESVHLRHTFAECPDFHCAGARDALEDC